ncbi:MAG: prepilin-type N-terminal cleavage/methylation domain-containing protein [Verrucomicrobiota bacterium]|jgi:prepilin-type N-terminal cleavage/methylation domain-containing protein
MTARFGQNNKQKAGAGFTLVEVVMSIAILALVMGGMLCGYVQTNRRAAWSSMSLAAQSFASQWAEQTRAATDNELHSGKYTRTSSMFVPGTAWSVLVTNYVSITNVYVNPQVWQIRVDCVWQFPLTTVWTTNKSAIFSNTVITWRGARQ